MHLDFIRKIAHQTFVTIQPDYFPFIIHPKKNLSPLAFAKPQIHFRYSSRQLSFHSIVLFLRHSILIIFAITISLFKHLPETINL